MAVAGAIPTVARDLVGLANSAGREDDRFGAKNLESPAFAIVTKRADHAIAVFQKRRGCISPCGHRCPDGRRDPAACGSFPSRCDRRHGPGADIDGRRNSAARMRPSLVRSNTAPHASSSRTRSGASFACSSAIRQLIDVLPAAHRVGEMHFPIVAIVHIRERGGDSAFRHDGVRFAEQAICKPSRPKRRRPKLQWPRANPRRPRR